MRIERIEVVHVELPLTSPFITSYGRHDVNHMVLVKMTGDGVAAWAETAPLHEPMYCAETNKTVMLILKEFLIPAVLGKDFETADELNAALKPVRGNHFAKAGLEIAFWAVQSKMQDVPLGKLLGGTRPEVIAGNSIGRQDSIEKLLDVIQEALDDGFQRIKLKVMPGWDLEVLERVRNQFPDIKLQVDANSVYSLDDLDHLRKFDAFDLLMIEQPLHYTDLVDHAALQAELKTPICLDESIKGPDDMRKAIQLKSCQIVNIKPGRVGGLANAVKIHDLGQEHGLPCWVGSMLETAIGMAICIELASLPNFVFPNDVLPTKRFYSDDTTSPILEMRPDGTFPVSTVAPWQPAPDEEKIARFTAESFVMQAS